MTVARADQHPLQKRALIPLDGVERRKGCVVKGNDIQWLTSLRNAVRLNGTYT